MIEPQGAIQPVPVCWECRKLITERESLVFVAICGHPDCISVCFHSICLMNWRANAERAAKEHQDEHDTLHQALRSMGLAGFIIIGRPD